MELRFTNKGIDGKYIHLYTFFPAFYNKLSYNLFRTIINGHMYSKSQSAQNWMVEVAEIGGLPGTRLYLKSY